MANLTNSNKLIGKFAQIESDISEIKESLPADGVGEGVITLGINDQGVGSFSVNQKNNEDINLVITRATVGLSNVNNTSDLDKPISTATQAALDEKANKSDLTTVYKYKGSVASASELPTEGMNVGDVYNLEDTGMNVAWNGSERDELGSTVDLSSYYTKTQTDALLDEKANSNDIKDSTITIKQGNTTKGTFTLNQATNSEIVIDETDLSNYYNKTEVNSLLDDKADKSELPTVNDARITIQKNGESVDSFTLNQNTDNTLNITVNKTDVGLGNVDNTSDLNKPISTATQTALDAKQDTLTAGTGITIENNVISVDGTGDVKYSDFDWKVMSGTEISDLSSVIDINSDTTLTAISNTKPGMQYVVLVNNEDVAVHTITLGTNTSGESVEIQPKSTKYLVFISVDGALQFQTCEGGGGGGETPGNGTITVTQGGVEKGTFTVNQSTDTTIALDAVSEDAMEYPDFNFVDKTGTTITLDLNSTITPTNDFTVNVPAEIKDGQIYILRVDVGAATFTMTLGTDITNPYNVDLTLGTNTIHQFVFLAVDGKLELQPQLLTKADVEQILRDHGLIS